MLKKGVNLKPYQMILQQLVHGERLGGSKSISFIYLLWYNKYGLLTFQSVVFFSPILGTEFAGFKKENSFSFILPLKKYPVSVT